jgi:hypothetical protein
MNNSIYVNIYIYKSRFNSQFFGYANKYNEKQINLNKNNEVKYVV